jgi:DNA repair and recombination protein RAD52
VSNSIGDQINITVATIVAKFRCLTTGKVISLANDIFEFNGWSSAIRNVEIGFAGHTRTGKVSLCLLVIVRVTLKDSTCDEDAGYGHIENYTGKATSFAKAKKRR